MKRSEMIKKMVEVIHDTAALSPEAVAKSILAMQTEAGMVPNCIMYHADGEYGTIDDILDYAEIDVSVQWENEE